SKDKPPGESEGSRGGRKTTHNEYEIVQVTNTTFVIVAIYFTTEYVCTDMGRRVHLPVDIDDADVTWLQHWKARDRLCNRPFYQRDVLKFAQYNSADAIVGRHTPGIFTNQTSFNEPRLGLIYQRTDHQRYAKQLGLLQRLEITKEDKTFSDNENDDMEVATGNGVSDEDWLEYTQGNVILYIAADILVT
ncbi:40S ribosomal protein SA-like protein, partial [Tanacetum coccineum]